MVGDLPLTLFYNGIILTFDKENTTTDSMVIFGDEILAIGNENWVREQIEKFKKKKNLSSLGNTILAEHDIGGACIVPGFIDAHMHPCVYVYYRTQIDLSGVRSYSDLGEALREGSKSYDSEEWVTGIDLLEDVFEDSTERYFPDRYDLDKFEIQRPVVVIRKDSHILSVNSLALEKIGIENLKNNELASPMGEIRLDGDGNPTGIFTETGVAHALEKIPFNVGKLNEAGKLFSKELASFGITTCGGILQWGEDGPYGKVGALEVSLIQSLIKERLIEQDFVFYIITDRPKKLNRIQKTFQKLNKEKDRFVVGGIKLFADGSFGARTACMFEPFSDALNGTSGFMVNEKEKLYQIIKETFELGFQVACHAIGDKANRIVVDVFKEVLNASSIEKKFASFRIEHASQLREDIIKDAASVGIIMACQPAFINSEYTWLENRMGAKRIKFTYPFRAILDAGITLAGASDAPIESASVLDGIKACVTRNGFVPEQSITTFEALEMFTRNAALALGQEKIKGSLEEGKLADFVILDKNPLSVPKENLSDIKIIGTYHRGKPIYRAK